MLEHHADAEAARGARIGDSRGRAVEDDLALVRREDAVDHLDEGRFAGAILPEQGVNFAWLDAQVDVVVRAHAGKGFADADEPQPQGSFDIHLDNSSLPSSSGRDAKFTPLALPPFFEVAKPKTGPSPRPPSPDAAILGNPSEDRAAVK